MNERGSWLKQLKDSPSSERNAVLMSLVSGVLKAKLQMSDADSLLIDKSYFELGLTSLGAVELQEELEQKINNRIDATALYNSPTVENLVTHLRNEVLKDYFFAQGTINTATESVDVKHSSRDEYSSAAKSLLDEMLNDIS